MKSYCFRITAFTLSVFILLVSPGCKDDIAFEAEYKTIIDTMYLNRKIVMESEMDSLCFINNGAFYQAAFDSIMEARIAQIEKQLQAAKAKNNGPQ